MIATACSNRPQGESRNPSDLMRWENISLWARPWSRECVSWTGRQQLSYYRQKLNLRLNSMIRPPGSFVFERSLYAPVVWPKLVALTLSVVVIPFPGTNSRKFVRLNAFSACTRNSTFARSRMYVFLIKLKSHFCCHGPYRNARIPNCPD